MGPEQSSPTTPKKRKRFTPNSHHEESAGSQNHSPVIDRELSHPRWKQKRLIPKLRYEGITEAQNTFPAANSENSTVNFPIEIAEAGATVRFPHDDKSTRCSHY